MFGDDGKSVGSVPFNERISKYPAGRQNVACITSEGLRSVGDNTHFDAASHRELGRRSVEAFLKLEAAQKDHP